MEHLVQEAARHGAQLIVPPELCTSGYMFSSRQEAYDNAQVSDGDVFRRIHKIASQLRVYVTYGFPELGAGNALYNSAALIGPDGLLSVYRKTHLWGDEALYFEPGDNDFPVINTEIGKISMLVCYDG
jgi:predicted amidohydrolase